MLWVNPDPAAIKALGEKFANIDQFLMSRVGTHQVRRSTDKKRDLSVNKQYSYGPVQRSHNSKRAISKGSSERDASKQHTLIAASTTDVQTNFESLIARYQSAKNMNTMPGDQKQQ